MFTEKELELIHAIMDILSSEIIIYEFNPTIYKELELISKNIFDKIDKSYSEEMRIKLQEVTLDVYGVLSQIKKAKKELNITPKTSRN